MRTHTLCSSQVKVKSQKEGVFAAIYEVVKGIPPGNVMTYGEVATCVGNPRLARVVGWALHCNPDEQHIPCHRVVKKDGSLSPSFAFGGIAEHQRRLEAEGVTVSNGKVLFEPYTKRGK
jgi:methylated-DNA-protein-cysteine methyltransferase-like protein